MTEDKTAAPPAPSLEMPIKHWAVFCALCKKEWTVPYFHPGKSICEDCERRAEEAQERIKALEECHCPHVFDVGRRFARRGE